MIPVEQHLARILETVRPVQPFDLGLLDAQGCVLATDIRAQLQLPGFTNSAMDGYAVHAADVAGASEESPVVLPVVNDIAAGNTNALSLATGQTMRIMTGAPMPRGADAVVLVEQTDGGVVHVSVQAAPQPGQHVRAAGEDVLEGQIILRSGTLLGPGQIALLAAAGLARVRVVPRPRVVVLSTGDELVEPGREPGFGQIVDSNSVMLTAAVRAVGATPYRVGGVPDDARQLMETLEGQLVRADAIITTGGVSMGAFDTVKEVLSRVGTMQFDKVAMRPGMPQGFGVLGEERVPVFTLPGEPGQRAGVVPRLRRPGAAGHGRASREGVAAGLRAGGGRRVLAVGAREDGVHAGRLRRRPGPARGWAGVAHARRPGRGRRAGGHSPGGHRRRRG